ncbi:MAG: deaminase [Patescibacteria group bacterium]
MNPDYLKRAVELAKASFAAGEFPAGAVLVTKSAKVYESKPSLPHNHGETMVIDMAIAAEGAPLTGAIIYASMQPCLMCSSKMYWAGIDTVHYVIPKSSVRADYAYESQASTEILAADFFKPIVMTHHPEFLQEALEAYDEWVRKIESV